MTDNADHRSQGLVQILSNIGSPNILLIGDFMLDKYVWGEVKRISQEAPIPVLNVTSEEVRPGGAGSVANNLAHLGANIYCYGAIGNDNEGKQLLENLNGIGVETDGIVQVSDRPTTVKVRMMGHLQSAGKGIQQLLRIDYEKADDIEEEAQDKIINKINARVPHVDIILISDMNKGVLSGRVLETVIRSGKDHKVPVIVDPRLSNDYTIYKGATAITPNRFETKLSTGIKITDVKSMQSAGRKLLDESSLEYVIITADKDGMFLCCNDGSCDLIPTVPKDVYDVSGAGDMVLSVFGFVVGSGNSFQNAAMIANIAAGIEVGKIGAVPVSKSEMLSELMGGSNPLYTKIKVLDELEEILNKHRGNNERIVFTNGCFDILHIGHIEYLKYSRQQGDILVIGLNTDSSVREQKGDTRPFVSEDERARLISALEDINYVVLFDELTPEKLIRRIKPDILVKGEDWKEKGVVGREFVESYGGKVILAPFVKDSSTTDIVQRILERNSKPR
ncbi:ADP-heptose synthase, bifunctional sugar kinase /adenylyltransferase [Candidatus Scalindua japonica]|uniref:Bifunctional protein HldE n=1 Tax=Candidatus Scalindua japonica TaxID=1284222 RepID=A0A286TV69_9BACT|nr:D-glycero-beta-D-manno-heptose 1-phosphate adenylyltransferase [Candidatus Scalindua japonica]GAX59782.1 ADP-heptose synthase, bifunctional sugar kinase /adenylyltransferase [Candidatus Scalindua japonica]